MINLVTRLMLLYINMLYYNYLKEFKYGRTQ